MSAYDMRISDWSSDVCSSDLSIRKTRVSNARLPGLMFWTSIRATALVPRDSISTTIGDTRIASAGVTINASAASAANSARARSEEHTSELQSLMRISYAVFCLKKKTQTQN